MSVQRTQAYVLRSLAFGDTSRIATLLGRECGKFSVIAKGYRNPTNACARALEPFRQIEIVYYHRPDRELQIASQADVVTWHAGLEERLDRFGYACASLELCDVLLPAEEPAPETYLALSETLDVLGGCSGSCAALVFRGFQARACASAGFLPVLESCAVCEGAAPAERLFAASAGGFVCRSCASEQTGVVEMSPEAAGLFRFLLRASAREVAGSFTPMIRPAAIEVAGLLERFLHAHVEPYRGLRSLTMLGDARRARQARRSAASQRASGVTGPPNGDR